MNSFVRPQSRTSRMGSRGPVPKKRMKIADFIRGEIASGRYRPSALLPDRAWFMRKFKVNAHMMQQVVEDLRVDGLVVSVPGHWTKVVDRMPFENRYLLLLNGHPNDAGAGLFSEALKAAAQRLAKERHVTFETEVVQDLPDDSPEYAEVRERIRSQRYAGVFIQKNDWDCERAQGNITNIDFVPMAYFGGGGHITQGNWVRVISGLADFHDRTFRLHLEECRKAGKRRIAVFNQALDGEAKRTDYCRMAKGLGLEVVADGYHTVDMANWNVWQFRRLTDLFLRSDAGRAAEAVILCDDNMVEPFAAACKSVFGAKAASRYLISAHGNFPLLRDVSIPMKFHGLDCQATLSEFLDYASSCRTGCGDIVRPRLLTF